MIDLSVPLSPQIKEPTPPSIQYKSHENGAHEAIKHNKAPDPHHVNTLAEWGSGTF